jgi:hypothetical protein
VEKILFIDLDDTLFQTLPKCPPGAELSAAAYLKDGTANSFMTGKQRALWQWFGEHLRVIPVTARSGDAFRRVSLPFKEGAIINFGGVILDHRGEPEAAWLEQRRKLAEESHPQLLDLLAQAQAFAATENLSLRMRIAEDYGIPFYWMAKYRERQAEHLDRLQEECVVPWLGRQAGAFYLHRNGNNLAVLPIALGKEHAVRHLIQRLRASHADILSLGMGDSRSDAAFLAECDYVLAPRRSQLFEIGLAPLTLPACA